MKKTLFLAVGLWLSFGSDAFAAGGPISSVAAWAMALAAGLGMGIAAFGASLGQGRAAAAALEGIARNPEASGRLFLPLVLGLALIEPLAIYAFVVSLQLIGKI